MALRVVLGPYEAERHLLTKAPILGGTLKAEPRARSWIVRAFGHTYQQNIVYLDIGMSPIDAQALHWVAQLPHLEVLVVGGSSITDGFLGRIHSLPTLRAIVLDCTDVTDAAIDDLRGSKPGLVVCRTMRRLISGLGDNFRSTAGSDEVDVLNGSSVAPEWLLKELEPGLIENFTSATIFGDHVDDALLIRLNIGGATALKSLELEGTSITAAGVTGLERLPRPL